MALCFKLVVKCKVFSFRNYGCIARHITSASDRSVLERSKLFIFNQKVQNFGRLNIFCDNIGVRVSSTSLWQENHATTARAFLAAKCDDEVAVSKELENIKKYFDWQVTHTEQGLSEITVNFSLLMLFQLLFYVFKVVLRALGYVFIWFNGFLGGIFVRLMYWLDRWGRFNGLVEGSGGYVGKMFSLLCREYVCLV